MAYRGIDRKRFARLLSLGVDEFEMRKFFTECRRQLILQGGKVQNLPHGRTARIQTLADRLPASTDEIVRGWFTKNVTMVDPEQAEAVVGVFKRYEEIAEQLPEDDARRYARSCLVHLFDENPPTALLEFLKTPIGGASGLPDESGRPADEQQELSEADSFPQKLPQVLVDLVEGRDADDHLEGLPVELATFVSGLQSSAKGRAEEAREALDSLSPKSVLRGSLQQFLRQQEAKKVSTEGSFRGLRIQDEETFEGSFDYESDEVLAYCTGADRPTAVFVHPIAVVRSGHTQRLSNETRRAIFPETGDIIAFPGGEYPRQPRRGEIGVWGVGEHETDRPTRFHLASEKRPVYQIRSVPFPSTDYDSVREFLKDQVAQTRGGLLQPLLFLLDDGLIVGARGEGQDLSRDEGFESGLFAWNTLPAHRLEGRLLVLGPLPKEPNVFECAPLLATVRKLFRSSAGDVKGLGKLTRAQLRELTESLGSAQTGLHMLRIQRIKGELERLSEQRDALQELVSVLMEHPSVKTRIDELIHQEAQRELAEKKSLEGEIARLQKERDDWEGRIRRQQAEHRKLRDETAAVVMAAFEKARKEGVETLAEVAVFQALSAPETEPVRARQSLADRSGFIAAPNERNLAPSTRDVIPTLVSLGVGKREATAFAALGRLAFEAGIMVCVAGVAARRAVEEWASAVGNSPLLFDSVVGLIDDNWMRPVLAKDHQPDVLAILDANLSALDIYARPLLDLVLARITDRAGAQTPAILLALTEGVGALPVPRTFERLSVTIDLDSGYSYRDASDLETLMSEVTNPDDGAIYRRLWRPAADRMCCLLRELEPEERALVLSLMLRDANS